MIKASAERAFAGKAPSSREVERYLESLHLEDLAIAAACAAGNDAGLEHFIREQRPALHRAADTIEPGGGARDIADSMYGIFTESRKVLRVERSWVLSWTEQPRDLVAGGPELKGTWIACVLGDGSSRCQKRTARWHRRSCLNPPRHRIRSDRVIWRSSVGPSAALSEASRRETGCGSGPALGRADAGSDRPAGWRTRGYCLAAPDPSAAHRQRRDRTAAS